MLLYFTLIDMITEMHYSGPGNRKSQINVKPNQIKIAK